MQGQATEGFLPLLSDLGVQHLKSEAPPGDEVRGARQEGVEPQKLQGPRQPSRTSLSNS